MFIVCMFATLQGNSYVCCHETCRIDGQRLCDHAIKLSRCQHPAVGHGIRFALLGSAQYNCCLPVTTDCRHFCPFCFFLFNFVRCPCNVFDMIVLP